MTSPRRFEQDLPAMLADLYVGGIPDYRDDLVRQTAAVRQRPAWTFPERWLPMDLVSPRASGAPIPWRPIILVATVAALLAALLALSVGSTPRLPDPFGLASNGVLVYARDGTVLTRATPADPPRVLIDDDATYTYALFSRRGDRLALLRRTDSGEDLLVAQSDGTGAVRIGGPFTDLDAVDWSPSGNSIVVGHVEGGVPVIDIVATDGSGARRLAGIPALSPSWRPPSGEQLLFRGQEAGVWSLYLADADADAGAPVRLDLEPGTIRPSDRDYDLAHPVWSPTGDRIAFSTVVDLPRSHLQTPGYRVGIASIDRDGNVLDQRRLEANPMADDELYPVFTQDGRRVVFQQRFGWTPPNPGSGVPTVDRVFIAELDGDTPPRDLGIESKNGDGIGIEVAPDGRSIFIRLWLEGEDWLADPDTGTARRTDLDSDSGVSWQRRGG